MIHKQQAPPPFPVFPFDIRPFLAPDYYYDYYDYYYSMLVGFDFDSALYCICILLSTIVDYDKLDGFLVRICSTALADDEYTWIMNVSIGFRFTSTTSFQQSPSSLMGRHPDS